MIEIKDVTLSYTKDFNALQNINLNIEQNEHIVIFGEEDSGKSSLLNLLAKENIYVKNELFATLETTTRNVWLEYGKEILFNYAYILSKCKLSYRALLYYDNCRRNC